MSNLTNDRLREIAASSTNVWASDLTKQVCAELLAARQRIKVLERVREAAERVWEDHHLDDFTDGFTAELRVALDAAKEAK